MLTLKINSLAKLIEFKASYDLSDIRRVRNTKSKWFTFTKNNLQVLFIIGWTVY